MKKAAFTKGILRMELPSQTGFCEESCHDKRDFVKRAASPKGFCEGSCLHKKEFLKRAAFAKGFL